jgi:hypothetical protein
VEYRGAQIGWFVLSKVNGGLGGFSLGLESTWVVGAFDRGRGVTFLTAASPWTFCFEQARQ